MKECLYLDQAGQPSLVYSSNLHLGHLKALELYLDSMKGVAFTKFQRTRMSHAEAKIKSQSSENFPKNAIKFNTIEEQFKAGRTDDDNASILSQMAFKTAISKALANNTILPAGLRKLISINFSRRVQRGASRYDGIGSFDTIYNPTKPKDEHLAYIKREKEFLFENTAENAEFIKDLEAVIDLAYHYHNVIETDRSNNNEEANLLRHYKNTQKELKDKQEGFNEASANLKKLAFVPFFKYIQELKDSDTRNFTKEEVINKVLRQSNGNLNPTFEFAIGKDTASIKAYEDFLGQLYDDIAEKYIREDIDGNNEIIADFYTDYKVYAPDFKYTNKAGTNFTGAVAEYDLYIVYNNPIYKNLLEADVYSLQPRTAGGFEYRNYRRPPDKNTVLGVSYSNFDKDSFRLSLSNAVHNAAISDVTIKNSKIINVVGDLHNKNIIDPKIPKKDVTYGSGIEPILNKSREVKKLLNAETITDVSTNKLIENMFGTADLNDIDIVRNKLAKKENIGTNNSGEYIIRLGDRTIVRATKEEIFNEIDLFYDGAKDEDHQLLISNIISFFNSGKKIWPVNNGENLETLTTQVQNILHSYDPKTDEIMTLRSINGFEDSDPNILVVRNRTGALDLIYVARNDGQGRVLSAKGDLVDNPLSAVGVSKEEFKKLVQDDTCFAKTRNIENDTFDLEEARLFTSAYIGMQLVQSGIGNTVRTVTNGVVNNIAASNNRLDVATSETRAAHRYQTMLKVFAENKDIQEQIKDTRLAEVFNSKPFTSGLIFKYQAIDELYAILDSTGTEQFIKPLGNTENLKKYLAGYIERNDNIEELKQYLTYLQGSVAEKLHAQDSISNLANKKVFMLITDAILEINNVAVYRGAIRHKLGSLDRYNLSSRVPHTYVQELHRLIEGSENEIKAQTFSFRKELEKYTQALLQYRSVALGTKLFRGDQFQIYQNLFIENPNDITAMDKAIAEGRANDLYKLKGPDHPKYNELSKAEKDYINFFNKHIKQATLLTASQLRKDTVDEYLPTGAVPIVYASNENQLARSEKGLLKKVGKFLATKLSTTRPHTRKPTEGITRLENRYQKEFRKGEVVQYSTQRQIKLGLLPDGSVHKTLKEMDAPLETNLEEILMDYVLEHHKVATYNKTLSAVDAMSIYLHLDRYSGADTKEAVDYIRDLVRLKIFSNYDDETIAKYVDPANKMTTMLAMGVSVKQNLLDFFTGVNGELSLFIDAWGAGKEDRMLNPGDMPWAVKEAMKSENTYILDSIGLGLTDSDMLASKRFLVSKNKSLFQSRWLLWTNNKIVQNFTHQLYLAHLKKIGAMPALSYSTDSNVVYDVSKDKRFAELFMANGMLKPKSALTAEQTKKLAEYEFFLAELSKEMDGTIVSSHGDKRPSRPLSHADILNLKEYNIKVFGSISKDAQIPSQLKAIPRLMFKFKNFIPTKISNYYTKQHPSATKTEVIWNPETNSFERKKLISEGILQTLWGNSKLGLSKETLYMDPQMLDALGYMSGIAYLIGKAAKSKERLSKVQKENMRKLRSDLILTLIIMAAVYGLLTDSEDDKKKEAERKKAMLAAGLPYKKPDKEVQEMMNKIMHNTLGDVSILSLSGQVLSGDNMNFASASILARAVKNTAVAIGYSATGDWDMAVETGVQLTSATNTIYKLGKESEYILPTLE